MARAKAVLLSHGLWARRFGSDPAIVGRALTINDDPVTVAGVLPASSTWPRSSPPVATSTSIFRFPHG